MIGRPSSLRCDQLNVERNGDPARDLVLQREQIARVAVETLSPQMSVGLGIDQLRVDADLVTRPTDASFEDITHAQLAPDLLHFYRLVPIGERGIARGYEHGRQERKRR